MPVLNGIAWGVVLCFLVLLITPFDYENYCFTQNLIPFCAILILYPALEDQRIRRNTIIFLYASCLALSMHCSFIVHSGSYTSNPAMINRREQVWQKETIKEVQTALEMQMEDMPRISENTCPAGPVVRSAVWPLISSYFVDQYKHTLVIDHFTSKRYTTYRLWHTWLTGIYGKRSIRLQLWYPGGTLKYGVKGLSYR